MICTHLIACRRARAPEGHVTGLQNSRNFRTRHCVILLGWATLETASWILMGMLPMTSARVSRALVFALLNPRASSRWLARSQSSRGHPICLACIQIRFCASERFRAIGGMATCDFEGSEFLPCHRYARCRGRSPSPRADRALPYIVRGGVPSVANNTSFNVRYEVGGCRLHPWLFMPGKGPLYSRRRRRHCRRRGLSRNLPHAAHCARGSSSLAALLWMSQGPMLKEFLCGACLVWRPLRPDDRLGGLGTFRLIPDSASEARHTATAACQGRHHWYGQA